MGVVPDITDLIQRSMKSLRDSERLVAEVVLADQHFAMSASATELAKRARVSAASITRFCRALGFQNLRDFKLCVAQNLAISAHFMSDSVARTDSFGELVRSVTQGLGAAITEMESEIDIHCLSEALDILAAARHINVFPLDQESQGAAVDVFNRLLRIGNACSCHIPAEEQRMVISAASDASAFLLLSMDTVITEPVDLFESMSLLGDRAILIAPPLAPGLVFPGVQLVVETTLVPGIFVQSLRRYKQAIMIDLICTGSALNLADSLGERRRRLERQTEPPLKR